MVSFCRVLSKGPEHIFPIMTAIGNNHRIMFVYQATEDQKLSTALGLKKKTGLQSNEKVSAMDIDAMSIIEDSATNAKVLGKIKRMKNYCEKILDQFRKVCGVSQKGKNGKDVKGLQNAKQKLDSLLWQDSKLNMKMVRALMKDAAKTIKEVKASIDKRKADEAAKNEEEEDEDEEEDQEDG